MLLYNFVFHPLMKNQKTEQKKKICNLLSGENNATETKVVSPSINHISTCDYAGRALKMTWTSAKNINVKHQCWEKA